MMGTMQFAGIRIFHIGIGLGPVMGPAHAALDGVVFRLGTAIVLFLPIGGAKAARRR